MRIWWCQCCKSIVTFSTQVWKINHPIICLFIFMMRITTHLLIYKITDQPVSFEMWSIIKFLNMMSEDIIRKWVEIFNEVRKSLAKRERQRWYYDHTFLVNKYLLHNVWRNLKPNHKYAEKETLQQKLLVISCHCSRYMR